MSLIKKFSRCIEYRGQWVFRALLWTVYTLGPLSIVELDSALAVKNFDKPGLTLAEEMYAGAALNLQQILPGVLTVRNGRTILSSEARSFVLDGLEEHLNVKCSPHALIAQTCLVYPEKYLSNFKKQCKTQENRTPHSSDFNPQGTVEKPR